MYHWVHIIEPGTQIIRALGSENTKTTNSPGENQNDGIKKTHFYRLPLTCILEKNK